MPWSPALVGAGAVATVGLAVAGLRQVREDPLGRLNSYDLAQLSPRRRGASARPGPLARLAERLAPFLRRLLGKHLVLRLEREIALAGRPDGMTIDVLLQRFARWGLIFAPVVLVFALNGNILGLALAVFVPFMMPLMLLARAKRLRQERIERDLPDFLDILAVTVTAGVAFRPALARVTERFEGPLADEIGLTLAQLSSGASVREAFSDLRARSESEPLSEFVIAFLDSEKHGAPLASTLNRLALDMRRDAGQRMRRKAARAAPRVTLVTSLVLVPGTLVLVIVGLLLGSNIDFDSLLQRVP